MEMDIANLASPERASLFVRAATEESSGPVDGPFRLAKSLLERDPALARADVYSALVLGDVEAVRRWIEGNPSWVGEKGGPRGDREPLLYVTYSKFHRESPEIAEGLLLTAQLLLDHGADPDASFFPADFPASPLRPLLGACGVADFPAMAELLLDRGATIDDRESLYHSTEQGDTRCLELLLARGANPLGTNALNHAFDRQGLDRIRLLLDHGADPNEVLGDGGPSLFWAIERGRERAVLELLVEHGADIHARRGDGKSAYRVAMQHGHSAAADCLAELGAGETAERLTPFERFAGACGRGDLAAARQAVAESPGLFENLSNDDRQAFLHIAQAGKAAVLGALLDCGLPVGTAGPTGETALHWAAWHGWRDAVSVLLAHGAPVTAVEEGFGATPLGWAEHGSENWPNPEGDYPGVIRLLLDAGADATAIVLG
ncbi:MAG: hypothetical protein QOJ16_196 [Acidobacteriota bacterium]|jgi:ankyrin repeat protein|nr:hypothetical protein [Acidobacteriota bacterium]